MSVLQNIVGGLRALFCKERGEQELDEELRNYLEAAAEAKRKAGMSPGDALRAARLELGGVESVKEGVRAAGWEYFLETIWQDIRFGARMLRKSPGFAIAAVLTLAIGIGANTALFSLWHAVLHASLPGVYRPEQLVMMSNPDDQGSWTGRWTGRTDGDRSWLTYSEFEQLRDHADLFSSLMASQSSLDDWQVRLDDGNSEKVSGRFVSGGFFQVLGVRPVSGRLFTAADDSADSAGVVVSYSYWQRRFGGRDDLLGKPVTIGKVTLTIMGVTPDGFIGESSGQSPDLWIPLRTQPLVSPARDLLHDTPPQKTMWLNVFGRLKPGVTYAQAETQANAVFQTGLESFYGHFGTEGQRLDFLDQHLRIHSGSRGASESRQEFSGSLTALLVAVGVLLMIACANISTLLLARGAIREPEFALRLSIGASKRRLIRQHATESLLLVAAGGVTGLVVAYFLFNALVRMVATSEPDFRVGFSLNLAVLSFNAGLVVAVTLLFGLLPIGQLVDSEAGATLKEQSRSATGAFWRRWSRFLVALQLALCLPLLVGAGILVRTIFNLQRMDLGFSSQGLLLVRPLIRPDATDARDDATHQRELLSALFSEIRQVPGVQGSSYSELGVFSGGNSISGMEVPGYIPRDDRDRFSATDVVGPNYFSTLGIPILNGREIRDGDNELSSKVCVINEAFAKRFFDGKNPVGMYVTSIEDNERTVYQVVGVAANARMQSLRGEIVPRYFAAASQQPSPLNAPIFLIRTTGDAAPVLAAVLRSIHRVSAGLSVTEADSIEDRLTHLTGRDRATEQIATVFGCVALVLAAIGLYGVISYGISRRAREIGIRLALGARPGGVISMILRETLGPVVFGLLPGAALTFAASRLINSQLYGVAPWDPITLMTATVLLLVVAFAASYLPARRAAKIDPTVALRYE